LAQKESCVILGRTGFHIFREDERAFKVFLMADKPFRREKVARRLNINEGSADLLIDEVDNARENFTKTFSGKSRYDARNYDLVLNVTGLEPKEVARFIAECVRRAKM
jgi:cytidylate kinase